MLRGLVSLITVLTATAGAEPYLPGAVPYAPARSPAVGPGAELPVLLRRRPLPFFYDLYTFRGPRKGATTVLAAFAVPVNGLERENVDSQVRYRFDVSFVLADTATRDVRRSTDSMYVAVPHPLGGNHLLYTQIQMLAPPSASTLQRVVMTDVTRPGIGQLYTTPFTIPDYSGSRLMLSDIALGLPDEQGGWKRGNVSLALLPTSQFPGGSFDLYYEIYNLPRNSRYITEVSVEPIDASGRGTGGGNPIVTRFSGISTTGADGSLPELRRVDTALENGRYRLTVTVKNQETGETATRSRILQVRDWQPGATLVPALPAVRRASS